MKNLTPLKNLVTEVMAQYFSDNPEIKEWRGTTSQFIRWFWSPKTADALRYTPWERLHRALVELSPICKKEAHNRDCHWSWGLWVFENPSRPGSTIKISDGIYLQ